MCNKQINHSFQTTVRLYDNLFMENRIEHFNKGYWVSIYFFEKIMSMIKHMKIEKGDASHEQTKQKEKVFI